MYSLRALGQITHVLWTTSKMQIVCLTTCKTVTEELSGHRIGLSHRRHHLYLTHDAGHCDVDASDLATPRQSYTDCDQDTIRLLFHFTYINRMQTDRYSIFEIKICVTMTWEEDHLEWWWENFGYLLY